MKRIAKVATGLMLFALIVAFDASSVRAAGSKIVVVSVDLGGSGLGFIKGFSLVPIAGAPRNKPQFSLVLSRGLTTDTSWISAFENSAVYDTVVVRDYDSAFNPIMTYTFSNATVTGAGQVVSTGVDGDAVEQLTLSVGSLSITTP